MSTTPNLALPLLAAAQAQKHVTHNEALLALDALVHCAILDKDLAAPPTTPAEGDRYIVAAGATGEWAGKSGSIVQRQDGAWTTLTPQIGFVAYLVDEAQLYVRTGAGWAPITDALGVIQNLARLGIGAVADATNPFTAKLNKALWTARASGEGGTGDLRYTLNKEAAGNVLSLLFQTGYSGRVELGLVGSDNLVAKVSSDGSTWRQALTIDAVSGGLDYLSGEASIASAATVDLGALTARRVLVTGTTTIVSFGSGANRERILRFADALVLTHDGTSLVLPGAANLTTAAGDVAIAVSDALGRWRVVNYQVAARGAVPTLATPSAQGEMSAADKSKLDGIPAGGTGYTHPTGDGNLHVPATGTTSNAKVLKAGATAASATWGQVLFTELGSVPTTIAGFGITDGLRKSTTDTITIGYTVTPNNIGTVSSGTVTPNPALGNYQYYANNGAHTLAAPTSDCAIDILVTNGASAGSTTFSGFTVGSSTGDALTTTSGHKFIVSIRRIAGTSTYLIKALQ